MSLRKRTHTDLASLKRSRSGYAGNVTKVADKATELEELALVQVNVRTVENLLKSLTTSEARYLGTLDEAQELIAKEEQSADLLEEEDYNVDAFQTTVAEVQERLNSLISLKRCGKSIRKLTDAIKVLRDAVASRPEADHDSTLTSLKTAYDNLLTEWDDGNHDEDHPLRDRITECGQHIGQLNCELARTREPTPTSAPDLSSTTISTTSSSVRLRAPKLPTLELPTFNGEVMKWATFWAAFKNQVGNREEISDADKLIYLRRSIKHQPTQDLLETPREEEDTYAEVVAELKRRFDRPKEVHKTLVQRIIQLTPIRETQDEIKRLMDVVRKTLLSIKRTGSYCIESFMTSLVFLLLPKKLQVLWEQHSKKEKTVLSVFPMLDFFLEHADTLTPSSLSTPHQAAKSDAQEKKTKPPGKKSDQSFKHRNNVHVSSTPTQAPQSPHIYKWECQLCAPEKHPLHACSKWLGYSVPQRLARVASQSLCSNCLAVGHTTATCRSTYRCRTCQQKHHSTIHQNSGATATQVNHASKGVSKLPDALMMTAVVKLTGPSGKTLQARALIDSGAGISLISNRVTQQMCLPVTKADLQFTGVQGTPCKSAKHVTQVCISSTQSQESPLSIKAAVVNTVTNDLPSRDFSEVARLPHLIGLQLADPEFHLPARIDLLLGADVYYKLIQPRPIRAGGSSDPAAIATIFGWAITGPVHSYSNSFHTAPTLTETLTPADAHLDHQMVRFWESEEPDKPPQSLSTLEEQVQEHYSSTTSYCPKTLRYTVTLPRKSEIPPLGESRAQAASRYYNNERSIIRRGVWNQFQDVVQSYLDLGHAEVVPPAELSSTQQYYLPMHSVTKSSSTTTKLRVVFDGSATTTSGMSLNQALHIGPTLHPTLGEILVKFRTYPIAVTADISKMYREVSLSAPDKDLHRFLWRAHPDEAITDYRMTRVTFGVSASPYLAVRTLQQTAKDHGEDYPEAAAHVSKSFYVDDLLAGATTPEEALTLHKHLRIILSKGGFNLCKWRSSNDSVLSCIPTHLQETIPVKEMTESHTPSHPKALGLEWDSRLDLMAPAIRPPEQYSTTKRGVVSDVSKTFDILGWISPAVLTMKLLYQQLWQLQTGWDEQIPTDLALQHSTWREQLPVLSSKQIPRCYYRTDVPFITRQVHGFADASLKAYGAVVYVRSTYANHPPIISLVLSKTRVAKLKPSTVPRQELCAAVLLTELVTEVKGILQISDSDVHCWSDSSIVLSWLDGHPRDYKVFVTNRVNSILQVTSPQSWKHVPTSENPADCASRGLMPAELLNHSLWWEGPDWLQAEPISIPPQPPRKPLLAPELRLPVAIHSILQPPQPLLESRYSDYHKLICVTAWCLRFLAKATKQKAAAGGRQLTAGELTRAEHHLARLSQQRSFPKERHSLLHDKTLSPSSRLLSLNPYLDQELLLRVGGRLENSSLTLSQKHPVLIDANDMFTRLLCTYLHVVLGHCGPTLLLASLGRRFHVVNARRLTRSTCSQCKVCRKAAPRTLPQQLGQLPADRVSTTPAFQTTGIDYAGPFTLKKGHTRKPVLIKSYLALFVCLSTKAVHIEVVSDMTTSAFIAALKRFIARRGCPTTIHSDNGSNFIGAKNQLKQLYSFLRSKDLNSSVSQHLLKQRITWNTIPERSPHFGGLWESAVKKMKFHLKRVIGSQIVSYEEMATVSTQVEACLNSRPLTAMTSHDSDGIHPLTPGHFLLLRPPTAYPELPGLPEEPSKVKKWHLCQSLVQHFWDRWSREYLQSLQARSKWKRPTPNLQVGDVVIIKEDRTFACHWPLARILQTYPGQDGLVRVALVQTGNSTYKRPITKLALIHREEAPKGVAPPSLPPGVCLGTPQTSKTSTPSSSSSGRMPDAPPHQTEELLS